MRSRLELALLRAGEEFARGLRTCEQKKPLRLPCYEEDLDQALDDAALAEALRGCMQFLLTEKERLTLEFYYGIASKDNERGEKLALYAIDKRLGWRHTAYDAHERAIVKMRLGIRERGSRPR